jgi:hypothetical protein
MNDQYLWDRTGHADPEVAELERILRPLAHDGRPLDLARAPRASRAPHKPWTWRKAIPPLALAAGVCLMVATAWNSAGRSQPGWTVDALDGRPRIGGAAIGQSARLGPGDRVETDARSRARLTLDGIGTIDVGPGSRVQRAAARPGAIRLVLEAGSVDATISASPGVFSVDTRASRAVDLGCKYTLGVDAGGSGVLRVTLGWVGLQWKGRESLVPAGAICATRAAQGPGTPRFEGATPGFIAALATLDAGVQADRDAAVTALLEEARPLDAITLWHLLTRLDPASAGRVYDGLAALIPPPAGVTRARVLAGNAPALAAWWEGLGLGDLDELRKGLRASYR